MARKTSADYRVELAELTDSVQALLDIAKDEDRQLEAPEQEQFDEWMAKIDETKKLCAAAEKFEAQKREIAEMRQLQSQPLAPIGGVGRNPSDRVNAHHRLGPLRAFKGQTAPRDAYDSGMWLRAMIARAANRVDEEAEARIATRGWDIRMVATEASPTGGGYLVPSPLANAIIDVRALAGIARQISRVVPMTSDTLDFPKKTAGTTVYYPGEGGTITASDQTWGNVELKTKKRAILSKISQELRDDAIISIIDDLASQMGLDFAVKEDAELVNGDGTATYGGEVGLLAAIGAGGVSTAATGHDTWPELDMADFTAAMAKLPSKYQVRGTGWLCSSQFYYGVMLKVLASAGGNTIPILEAGAGAQERFLGKPVFMTDQMPTATATATVCALYGSFSDAVLLGDRMSVEFRQSEHLNFAEDLLALRAITRYDFNVHDTGTASAAGAYVALKTAS